MATITSCGVAVATLPGGNTAIVTVTSSSAVYLFNAFSSIWVPLPMVTS